METIESSLGDLTPLFGNEHWETWVLLHRLKSFKLRPISWQSWVAMWRAPLDKYWDRHEDLISATLCAQGIGK